MKVDRLEILYINLGDNVPYTYDKIAGRVLSWTKEGNHVTILVPELSQSTIRDEIQVKSPKLIDIATLPFTNYQAVSPVKIIFIYLVRMLLTPLLLFKNLPRIDFAISNSAFIVDIFPVLVLKLFGRCKYWILIMDSVIPHPSRRQGSRLVNSLTYFESIMVSKVAGLFADLIFTVNPILKDEIALRGVSRKKIALTKNGLFLNNITGVTTSNKYHFEAVYQGRISENKGVDDLIQVWKKVTETYPNAKLVIMGTGLNENIEKLNRSIKKCKLEENISYLGFTARPKKYQIMKSSKLFLYLSKVNADESWGISLMEALACGLPSISYDLPIYDHIYTTPSLIKIKNGHTNLVAKQVINLLKNPELRNRLSLKAAAFTERYDWSVVASDDLKTINGIMKNEK